MINQYYLDGYVDDTLAKAFRDRACLVTSMWNGKFSGGRTPRPAPLPNKDELVAEMRAIGDEMVARGLTTQARALFDDPDDDVRGWASDYLDALDPEWQGAARTGALKGRPTQQILGFYAHVWRGPLPGPALTDCTTEQLLKSYEDAGLRVYAVHFLQGADEDPYSVGEYNKCISEMRSIFNELQARGQTSALFRLFDHPNESVRCVAAAMCLDQFPKQAVPVLVDLVGKAGTRASLDASITLRCWREKRHRGQVKN